MTGSYERQLPDYTTHNGASIWSWWKFLNRCKKKVYLQNRISFMWFFFAPLLRGKKTPRPL